MEVGMALADAAVAINKTIQQLLLERELQRLGVSPAQVIAKQQSRADEELGLRKQEMQQRQAQFESNQQRQARMDEETSQARTATEASALGDQLPPGVFMPSSDPAVAMMQQGGRGSLLQPSDVQRPPMGESFTGPMDTGETPQEAQIGKQRGFLKTMSQKQRDTEADNARMAAQAEAQTADRKAALENQRMTAEQASADRRSIAEQASADRRAAIAARPQTTDAYGDWQKKYDYELAHPKPTAGGGGTQGLQRARADSAVQMLDRLQQVHSQLQAGEGPGQIVKGIGQRIKGALNLENPATEYAKLRKATAVALAVAIQGSRPSDADAEAMAALLPDLNTPAEVATHLFESSKAQLRDTSAAMGGAGLHPSGQGSPTAEDLIKKYGGK